MESHFAQNTTPNPCSLLSRHKPPASGLSGICTYTKHLNSTSDPKTPHSWPELKSGQNELQSGQNGPKLGKMVEKCAKLFWSGQKKFIHTTSAASTSHILVQQCLRGFCSSQAVHFSCSRVNHILLFVVRQFVGIL